MVVPGGIIEFSIVNAHALSHYRFSTYELIYFIPDNGHTPFLELLSLDYPNHYLKLDR